MGLFVWYFGTKGTKNSWKDVGHHTIINGPRYRGLLKDIFDKKFLPKICPFIYIARLAIDKTVVPDGADTFYALSPVPNLKTSNPVNWDEMGKYTRKNFERY